MSEIQFHVTYGQRTIRNNQVIVRMGPGPEPSCRQRFKWFCSRNRYVPLYVLGAVLLAMWSPMALITFAVSFVMSFLLVTLMGLIMR